MAAESSTECSEITKSAFLFIKDSLYLTNLSTSPAESLFCILLGFGHHLSDYLDNTALASDIWNCGTNLLHS